MVEKKKVKKIQISIPEDKYQEVEKMWIGLGFSSVAEASKFLLMNKVDEFYRQTRKSQKAVSKLQDLKKTSINLNAEVALVQPKGNQINQTASAAKQQTSGYIEKDTFEYKRITSDWRKHNPNFEEPLDVKGLRWWIDETTKRTKMGWWRDGSK